MPSRDKIIEKSISSKKSLNIMEMKKDKKAASNGIKYKINIDKNELASLAFKNLTKGVLDLEFDFAKYLEDHIVKLVEGYVSFYAVEKDVYKKTMANLKASGIDTNFLDSSRREALGSYTTAYYIQEERLEDYREHIAEHYLLYHPNATDVDIDIEIANKISKIKSSKTPYLTSRYSYKSAWDDL